MYQRRGFTLVELAISVFILVLLLLLAVPSLNGVMADRRLRQSLDALNRVAAQAQELSITQRRPYLLVWEKDRVTLRPEVFAQGEEEKPIAILKAGRGEAYTLDLPAALTKEPAPEWIFWPSGVCEPATVGYKGPHGAWSAMFSALTGRSTLRSYVAR